MQTAHTELPADDYTPAVILMFAIVTPLDRTPY